MVQACSWCRFVFHHLGAHMPGREMPWQIRNMSGNIFWRGWNIMLHKVDIYSVSLACLKAKKKEKRKKVISGSFFLSEVSLPRWGSSWISFGRQYFQASVSCHESAHHADILLVYSSASTTQQQLLHSQHSSFQPWFVTRKVGWNIWLEVELLWIVRRWGDMWKLTLLLAQEQMSFLFRTSCHSCSSLFE